MWELYETTITAGKAAAPGDVLSLTLVVLALVFAVAMVVNGRD